MNSVREPSVVVLARIQFVALLSLALVSCDLWEIFFPEKETRWELFTSNQCTIGQMPECIAVGSGDCCYDYLATVIRENGRKVEPQAAVGLCCWRCKNGRNACNYFYPGAYPGKLVGQEESEYCEKITTLLAAGFALNNTIYRKFADYIAWYAGVPADKIVLFGSTTSPGTDAVTFGQMWCAPDGKYYIRVYVYSHIGHPRQEVLNTIAHEIKHAQQMQFRGSCGGITDADRAALEADAQAFGNMIAPPCDGAIPSPQD